MNRFALLLCSLLAGCLSFAAHATDFTQPQPGLQTGGQPSHGDLARLKSEGVRTVIDLRGAQEDRGYDEATEAQRLGLTYIACRDPERLLAKAKSAGATVIRDLVETDYGSQDFIVADPEGNQWSFGTFRPVPEG